MIVTKDQESIEERIRKMKREEKAVQDIIKDMEDRSGLGDEWDQIASYVQEEIKETWSKIIIKAMTGDSE